MIVGLGVDVVELDRIEQAIARFGQRFYRRILTETERLGLPKHPVAYVAARFAAKEAASKALGTGFSNGVSARTIGVVGGERRKPELALLGPARERADELGVTAMHVSLTHGRDVACAVVVLER